MTPDAARHNPDPRYLRQLLQAARLNQVEAAARLGITVRTLRYYLSEPDSPDYRPATYLVQFALECAAAAAAAPVATPAAAPLVEVRADLSAWRALEEADIEAQAPAGLSWQESWAAVEVAVAERYAQLPVYLQGGGLEDGEHWPESAIDPALFERVMTAQAQVLQGLQGHVGDVARWLLDDADRPGPTLHRLLAVERQTGRLQVIDDLGVLPREQLWPLLHRTAQMRDRLTDLLADQARAGDLAVVPWAFVTEVHSPVPAPSTLGLRDAVKRKRLQQAEAEWQAQQLETRAATWLSNAEALRLSHGGPARTAAALRTVLHKPAARR